MGNIMHRCAPNAMTHS